MKNALLRATIVAVLALLLGAGFVGWPQSAHAAAHVPTAGPRPAFTCDPGTHCYYENMYQGDYLNSTSSDYVFFGQYRLVMQGDGNLVLYSNSTPVWATGTNNWADGATYKTALQGDGNFVVYCYGGLYFRCGYGTAIWATNIYGSQYNNGKDWIQISGYDPYGNYHPNWILDWNPGPPTVRAYSCNYSQVCSV